MAAELAEVWGIADPYRLMESMTPEQLDFWVAKDEISPIGHSGLVELLATIGAAFLSSKDHQMTPNDIKKACIVHGENWKPLEPQEAGPMTATQAQSLIKSVGG